MLYQCLVNWENLVSIHPFLPVPTFFLARDAADAVQLSWGVDTLVDTMGVALVQKQRAQDWTRSIAPITQLKWDMQTDYCLPSWKSS